MKRLSMIVAAVCVPMFGCAALLNLLRPDTVRVRLVNDSSFPVEVKIFIGKDQDAPRDVLTSMGEKIELTVAAGEVSTLDRSCDDLQAIVIDNANLQVIGSVGPDAQSNVLRDGGDFNCGDVIQFTFDHTDLIVDFRITTTVRDQQ